jgi:hypothetical protein
MAFEPNAPIMATRSLSKTLMAGRSLPKRARAASRSPIGRFEMDGGDYGQAASPCENRWFKTVERGRLINH